MNLQSEASTGFWPIPIVIMIYALAVVGLISIIARVIEFFKKRTSEASDIGKKKGLPGSTPGDRSRKPADEAVVMHELYKFTIPELKILCEEAGMVPGSRVRKEMLIQYLINSGNIATAKQIKFLKDLVKDKDNRSRLIPSEIKSRGAASEAIEKLLKK